ncbi:sigma factor [Prevotella sp.]|uniref:sigma factor n=1 Tax=Prevotella sp. TaxID=59823 RepID=UPI003F8147D8
MNDFERLFNRLYPRVKLFAMQLLKHEDEAEDVAQNVFAKLWEMPEKWSEDNVDSYVFVMTRNHVLNVIRYHRLHESGGGKF